jgi:hypothetical protein
MISQISNAGGDSKNCVNSAFARVSELLLLSFPLAVFLTIVAVIVFSADACSRWAITHVGSKASEVMSPLWAHADTPSAVMFPIFIGGVVATVDNVRPDTVKRMFDPSGGPAMSGARKATFYSLLCVQAPARFCVTGYNIITTNDDLFSASTGALDKPSTFSAWVIVPPREGDNFKPSKCLTDEIGCVGHNDVQALLLSSSGCLAETNIRCDCHRFRMNWQGFGQWLCFPGLVGPGELS